MSQQFNGVIAKQIVPFRGTSTIDVLSTTASLSGYRSLTSSVYSVNLAGGQSGTFGIHVVGNIGGVEHIIAGFTGKAAAAGDYVLYPVTYGTDGIVDAFATATSAATKQIDQLVPPSSIVLQAGVATHGISSTITVSAVLVADR